MPTITLKREEVQRLHDFCVKNALKQFFIAKDEGAYVGASVGQGNNCIFYFRGCDPRVNADWYDRCHAQFGGDDFGEHLPVIQLTKAIENVKVQAVKIVLTKTQIKVQYVG